MEKKTEIGFTGKCVCGRDLEAAYDEFIGRPFWNCFVCLPFYERASPDQEEWLCKHTAQHYLGVPEADTPYNETED